MPNTAGSGLTRYTSNAMSRKTGKLSIVPQILLAIMADHRLNDHECLKALDQAALSVMQRDPGKTAKPQYDKVHFSR